MRAPAHRHDERPTRESIPTLTGIPVLDIGGDVGAIVVRLSHQTLSGELEACPTDAPEHRFHTGVHFRGDTTRTTYIAVFPQVTEGHYDILHHDGTTRATVEVIGGGVAELDLG
jgi:hypothetical protein